MNAPSLAGNQAPTSPACEGAVGDDPAPAAANEPGDVAEEVVSPEQRKARRKRKRNEVESRLSFADELGDGEEEAAASPRASLGALTADRFEAEAKASRKRSSCSSSSSQRLLRDAALSSAHCRRRRQHRRVSGRVTVRRARSCPPVSSRCCSTRSRVPRVAGRTWRTGTSGYRTSAPSRRGCRLGLGLGLG